MSRLLIAAGVVSTLMSSAQAESRTYHDARGSYAGSSTTRNGHTSFTDGAGRYVGSAITHGGTTTVYDRRGSYAGSSTRR
jgi:hypothetical protein